VSVILCKNKKDREKEE